MRSGGGYRQFNTLHVKGERRAAATMRAKNRGRFASRFKVGGTSHAGGASIREEWLGAQNKVGDQRAGRDETQRTAELGVDLV